MKTWKKLIPRSRSESASDKSPLRGHTKAALPFISSQSSTCWSSITTPRISIWIDFELIQINTDSMYMVISGEFDEIVKLELQEEYDHGGKAELLLTYHDRTPGLFKAKFQGKS